MAFAKINGHRLYFEDSGAEGPAVVFSHGFVLDHSMWDEQVAALGEEFRCITWDERGHGMSECHGPFDFYDSASDLVGLLDHLGIESATLVGMSQGGFLSQRAAVRFSGRVRALVLVDTGAAIFPPEVIAGYRDMQSAWEDAGPTGETATAMAAMMFGPDWDAGAWIGKWQSKPPTDLHEPWETVLGRDDFLDQLQKITVPSLVFQGSEDQAFDMATARELRDRLGDCKGLVVVDGGHHAPNVTHPDAFNASLAEFLREHA